MTRSSTNVVNARATLREEMAGGNLGDDRLNARRNRLIEVLGQSPDAGFPEAGASDGDTEARYRFHHLLFRKSNLLHGSLVGPRAPFSQASGGPKNATQVSVAEQAFG